TRSDIRRSTDQQRTLTFASGPSRARTGDLMAASHALYQLSYGPVEGPKLTAGAPGSLLEEPFSHSRSADCATTYASLPSPTRASALGRRRSLGVTRMSELLMKGLASTKREL